MRWGPTMFVLALGSGGCTSFTQASTGSRGEGGLGEDTGSSVSATSDADGGDDDSAIDGSGGVSAEGGDDATSNASADGDSGMVDGDDGTSNGESGPGDVDDGPGDGDTGSCMPSGAGQWADCNQGQACGGAGGCFELPGGYGGCSFPCQDACDCPPATTGTAAPHCTDFGLGPVCYLDCSSGETCPDGMVCEFGSCFFVDAGSTTTGGTGGSAAEPYEACSSSVPCPDATFCATDAGPEHSTCLPSECSNDSDCPDAAAGGTPRCGYVVLGGGTECYLSCGGSDSCPGGYDCIGIVCMQPFPG